MDACAGHMRRTRANCGECSQLLELLHIAQVTLALWAPRRINEVFR